MPIYDYKCTSCKHQFEYSHRINDAQPSCPKCSKTCKKQFLSPPSMHGHMASGREKAMRSLQPKNNIGTHEHKAGCGCSFHNSH